MDSIRTSVRHVKEASTLVVPNSLFDLIQYRPFPVGARSTMRSARLLIFIYFPVLAFTASISKSGCDSNEPTISLSTRHSVTLSSSNRTYMYFLPSTYSTSTPNPLILSFHGAGRTSDWQADLDRLTDPFFNPDHVLVYPQALQYGATSDFIYWEGAPNATADDVGYVADILDELEQKLCLDTSRIYATGKSQGGGMAARLACNQVVSQRIAAFAPVSGAFYTDDPTCGNPSTEAIPCNPGRDKIPVLDFHGGNDTTISIDGGPRNGGCLPAIQHWVSDWVARDNLTTDTSQTESLTDSLTGSAQMYQYGDGSENGLVTFVYDGDHVNHDWPATIPNSDNEAHGSGPASFNASSMIMAYFQKYDLS
ncbi:carbohydrate esterase family 1 protein [Xylariales sp. AK1849]|nr:carbohydrate esterase family 1 protein [Xylariales sp. AK1849]